MPTQKKAITFIHTADIHFGMENYGRIDHKTGIHTRLLDFKKSLETCINNAIKNKVDFFLFCGDAYKTATPSPTQQKLLLQLFLKLQCAGIPIVIIVGNHDLPASFGKAHSLDIFSDLPLDGLHVVSKPEVIKLNTKNGPINIAGMPWPTRHNLVTKEHYRFKNSNELTDHISEQMGLIIQNMATSLDPDIPAVLAGHLTVANGVFSGSERRAVFGTDPILLPSQLAIAPFDYVALGHLHRHQNLNKKGKTPVIYSGSVEAIDFGERRDKKGYCLVSVTQDKRCSYEFISLATRPMLTIEHHMESGKNQTEQLVEAINKESINNAIIKIVYHLPKDISDRVDLSVIQKATSKAVHVASIIPVHLPPTRQRRAQLNNEMNLEELLTAYLRTKEIKPAKIKDLLAKAHKMHQKVTGLQPTIETPKQQDKDSNKNPGKTEQCL